MKKGIYSYIPFFRSALQILVHRVCQFGSEFNFVTLLGFIADGLIGLRIDTLMFRAFDNRKSSKTKQADD